MKQEHRRGWFLGVSPGHFITIGIALLTVAVSYGASNSDIENNKREIEKTQLSIKEVEKKITDKIQESERSTRQDISVLREDIREIRELVIKSMREK